MSIAAAGPSSECVEFTVNDTSTKTTFAAVDYWQRVGIAGEGVVLTAQAAGQREIRYSYGGFDLVNQGHGVDGISNLLHSSAAPLPERGYDAPNRSFVDASAATQLDVFYGTSSPTVWTTSAKPAGGTCPATGGTAIPSSTIYVRVSATVIFRSLIAALVGHSSSTSAASARIRLSGTPVPLS